MTCHVYAIAINQGGRQFEAEVILSDRVIRGAYGRPAKFEKAASLCRRVLGIPPPGVREPHAVKQYLVSQFNSAMMDGKPKGYVPIDLRQFRRLTVTKGRRATSREHLQYLVLGLMNIPDALTPQANGPTIVKRSVQHD